MGRARVRVSAEHTATITNKTDGTPFLNVWEGSRKRLR